MSPRPILRWPDARLRQPAAAVASVGEDTRATWDEMVAVMEAMPGLGLAAVQIGVPLRLAVVDASRERGRAVRLANPEIVAASPETIDHAEASPCLPGVSAVVRRPARVTVRFLDETGAEAERAFEGLWAVSVQHQIDHLAGRMYFDRLSRVKRDMLLRKARKG